MSLRNLTLEQTAAEPESKLRGERWVSKQFSVRLNAKWMEAQRQLNGRHWQQQSGNPRFTLVRIASKVLAQIAWVRVVKRRVSRSCLPETIVTVRLVLRVFMRCWKLSNLGTTSRNYHNNTEPQ